MKQLVSDQQNDTQQAQGFQGFKEDSYVGNTDGFADASQTDFKEPPAGENATSQSKTEEIPTNKHFYMSAKLDNTRVNRDVQTYLQEIIQHLMSVDGSNVELRLEVDVTAPKGIPASTVRTVSENCRTLKVDDFGFEN